MWLRNLTVYCFVKRVLEPNLTQHMVIHILGINLHLLFIAKWDIMRLSNITVYCIVKHVPQPNLTQHMLIHILHTLANLMQSRMWLCNLTIFLHNMLDILYICCQSTPKLVMAWDFVIATRQPGSSLRMCYQVQIWGWAHHIFKFVIWCHSDPYQLHQTQIYYFKYLK